MKEKIIEMLKMQEALDKSFMEYKRLDKLDIRKVKCALRDELGEVNHEMKGDWCYWKKSQKHVDREVVKEELADVYHFALSLHMLIYGFEFKYKKIEYSKFLYRECDWFEVLKDISNADGYELYYTIILTEKLGFTFDEVYEAYMKKNKVNYERMKEGY